MRINFSRLVDRAEQTLANASPRTNLLCALGGGAIMLAGIALSQESSLAGMLVEDIGALPVIAGIQTPILRAIGLVPSRQNHESNV
jgi:hypothetical protein